MSREAQHWHWLITITLGLGKNVTSCKSASNLPLSIIHWDPVITQHPISEQNANKKNIQTHNPYAKHALPKHKRQWHFIPPTRNGQWVYAMQLHVLQNSIENMSLNGLTSHQLYNDCPLAVSNEIQRVFWCSIIILSKLVGCLVCTVYVHVECDVSLKRIEWVIGNPIFLVFYIK